MTDKEYIETLRDCVACLGGFVEVLHEEIHHPGYMRDLGLDLGKLHAKARAIVQQAEITK